MTPQAGRRDPRPPGHRPDRHHRPGTNRVTRPLPGARCLKKQLLLAILRQPAMERVLIFSRTKHRARSLARDLVKHGHLAAALQGNMSQNARQAALDGFRDGTYPILVATDIAARGIDVLEITHVINFDMPDTVDAYTHRIAARDGPT